MPRRLAPVTALSLPLLLALTGCAMATPPPPTASATPAETSNEASEARAQAQAWLDAAVLPPEAVRASYGGGEFGGYTGWPCRPVEQLEGFWTIPGAEVAATANWLRSNPTADLVTTSPAPVPEYPETDTAMIGYIPADGSHQGVVYTIAKRHDGVAVRAEVAALTASAECPALPDGGVLGPPGQG